MNRVGGYFIAIEGPSGVGKSTLGNALADALRTAGVDVLETKQPTSSPLGELARSMANDLRGVALALLVAADRYHHLSSTILPALEAGRVVICDRYVPSSMVLQTLDGVAGEFIEALNEFAPPPDLYVFLEGQPRENRERSSRRGRRDRFHYDVTAHEEADRYREVAEALANGGTPTLRADVTGRTAEEVATPLIDEILKRVPGLGEVKPDEARGRWRAPHR